MEEIKAGIKVEAMKFVESLSSMITAVIVKKIIDTNKSERSVIIYR